MPIVRIPLVGSPHSRIALDADTEPSLSTLDQRFINMLFKREANPLTGDARVRAFKRPGLVNAETMSATSTVLSAGTIAQIQDRTIFSVWGFSGVAIHAILNTNAGANVSITAPVAASRPIELNVDGTPQVYFHVVTSTTTAKAAFVASIAVPPVISAQTDGDLPETTLVGSFAGLDGYLFIADKDGAIWNSDLNNDTSWTATSFLDNSTQSYGRGVFNYKDKIGLFSEETIEFYENVGNPTGSPLQRVDHLTLRSYGLPLPDMTALDSSQWYLAAFDTVFWINNRRMGNLGIYMLDGFRPVKISSPDVDFALSAGDGRGHKIIGFFTLYGLRYLAIDTGDTATQHIWLYCIDLGTWTTLESPLCTGTINPTIFGNDGVITQDLVRTIIGNFFYHFDTGSLRQSDVSYTDGGSTFTATIQTRVLDFGTNNRKRFKSMSLLGPDPREASTCVVTTSLDDGQNFGNSRNIDLDSDDRRIFRQGVARRIQWRIANAADAACELEDLEVDYEVMAR